MHSTKYIVGWVLIMVLKIKGRTPGVSYRWHQEFFFYFPVCVL